MYRQVFREAVPIESSVPGHFQYFRTCFQARKGPAKLRISADFQVLVYCNGRNILIRKESGFGFHRFYDEVTLMDELTEGENCLALLAVCRGTPLLALEVEQNKQIVCATGKHWKTAVETAYLPVVRAAAVAMPESREERFDARKCRIGWQYDMHHNAFPDNYK